VHLPCLLFFLLADYDGWRGGRDVAGQLIIKSDKKFHYCSTAAAAAAATTKTITVLQVILLLLL